MAVSRNDRKFDNCFRVVNTQTGGGGGGTHRRGGGGGGAKCTDPRGPSFGHNFWDINDVTGIYPGNRSVFYGFASRLLARIKLYRVGANRSYLITMPGRVGTYFFLSIFIMFLCNCVSKRYVPLR